MISASNDITAVMDHMTHEHKPERKQKLDIFHNGYHSDVIPVV